MLYYVLRITLYPNYKWSVNIKSHVVLQYIHIVFFGNMVDVYTPNCCICTSNCCLDPIPLSIPIKRIKPIGRLYYIIIKGELYPIIILSYYPTIP